MKMRKFRQEKLWRDKAPELMEGMGSIIHLKKLTDDQYDIALRLKLIEEAGEVKSVQSIKELKKEMADLYEVLDALMMLHNINKDDVLAIQAKKRTERGGFFERKFVTIAEHPEGGYGEKYCLADPDKYSEITS